MGAAEAVHTAQLTRTQFHFSHRALSASDSALAALDSAHIVISAVEPALRDAMRRHTGALFIDVNAVPSAIACGRRLLYASAPATALADAVLWDARLEKYGAQQVNERFQRASGHTMDGDAWLGWFATKVALELHLRARTAQPDSLASIARSARIRFDGHKGRPLAFDATTGVLLQPLYRRAADGALSEDAQQYEMPACTSSLL